MKSIAWEFLVQECFNGKATARDELLEALAEKCLGFGEYYCLPRVRHYPEPEEIARDLSRDGFMESFAAFTESAFCWSSKGEFFKFFYTIYQRKLNQQIKRWHKNQHDRYFEDEFPVFSFSSETRDEIIWLVVHFESLAEEFHQLGQRNHSRVAKKNSDYIKCEVALCTKKYSKYEWENLPTSSIIKESITDLLDDLEQGAAGEIGFSASHLRFHDFLMKELCPHYVSKEDRDRYCTLFDRSVTELRTMDKLEMAYNERLNTVDSKEIKRALKDAFEKLSQYISCRDRIDMMLHRFKAYIATR